MDRLYAPSNSAEHPQHPVQLLLFVSSLGIDRKPKSAKDRFIDSSNGGLHSRKSIHRIAERDEAPCCRPGLVGVCGTRWGERFLLAAQPQPSNGATRSYIPALKPDRGLFGSRADQSWTGVHTSDVSQIAGSATRARLRKAGIAQSMGSKGDCYDNAVCESFHATLEKELLRRRSFRSKQEARTAIFDWIETWYNRERRHSRLGYRSPAN